MIVILLLLVVEPISVRRIGFSSRFPQGWGKARKV